MQATPGTSLNDVAARPRPLVGSPRSWRSPASLPGVYLLDQVTRCLAVDRLRPRRPAPVGRRAAPLAADPQRGRRVLHRAPASRGAHRWSPLIVVVVVVRSARRLGSAGVGRRARAAARRRRWATSPTGLPRARARSRPCRRLHRAAALACSSATRRLRDRRRGRRGAAGGRGVGLDGRSSRVQARGATRQQRRHDRRVSRPTTARGWLTAGRCPSRTGSRASGSTPPSPGCSACPGPRRPSWSRPAASRVDGATVAKSDRVAAGAWLEVELPAPPAGARGRSPSRSPGCGSCYDDDDIVVVDKPVGVAAHPSPGWTGPTVLGGLAAAGLPRSPPPAPPSARASCTGWTSAPAGLMVVAKSERAYTALKRAFKERTVDKTYHALVQGHPDPMPRHDRRADRPAPRARLQVGGRRGRQAERHALRDARGVPRGLPARDPPRDRPHAPDPGALRAPCGTLRRRPHLRRRPDPGRPARADRQWLHAVGSASSTRRTGRRVELPATTRRTCSTRSTSLRADHGARHALGGSRRRRRAPSIWTACAAAPDPPSAARLACMPLRSGLAWDDSDRPGSGPPRSCTCTCTPSTRCSTARPGSATCSPRPREQGMPAHRHDRPRQRVRRLRLLQAGQGRTAIKPIIGIEAYVTPEHQPLRPHAGSAGATAASDDVSGGGAYTHMTLLAADHRGHAQPVPAGLAAPPSRASSTSRAMDRELLADLRARA